MRFQGFLVLASVAAFLACPCEARFSDQAWPMCYHDAQNTGKSPYPGPMSFAVKWQMPDLQSGGVIGSGGVLYVSGPHGNATTIYAVDILSGQVLASSEQPCIVEALGPDGTAYAVCMGISNSIRAFDGTSLQEKWNAPVAGMPVGSMIVAPSGDVLVRTYEDGYTGKVLSLEAQTGHEKWEISFYSHQDEFGLAVTPGNRVIVSSLPSFSLDASTGAKLWENNDVRGYMPILGSNGIGYEISGGMVDDTGTLDAFDIDSGKLLWSTYVWGDYPFRTPPAWMIPGTPALDSNGRVYLPWGRYLWVFDGVTGDYLCQEKMGSDAYCTSVVLDGLDNAYLKCSDIIYVLEPVSFRVIAQYELPPGMDRLILGPEKTLYSAGTAIGEGGFYLPNLYLLPAAAHIAGAMGTNWRTDMVLHNPSSFAAAHASLALLRTGQDNSGFESVEREIPPNTSLGIDDAVLSLFGHDGSGAIMIQSNVSNLVITSRTYNDQPGGTYGQFIPAISESHLGVTLLTQLTENDIYRTNVGMASLSELKQTVSLDLYDSSGTLLNHMDVVLPPLGHVQLNQIYKTAGVESVKNGFIKISGGTRLAAYASVVDNRTGDAIYIPAAMVGNP